MREEDRRQKDEGEQTDIILQVLIKSELQQFGIFVTILASYLQVIIVSRTSAYFT